MVASFHAPEKTPLEGRPSKGPGKSQNVVFVVASTVGYSSHRSSNSHQSWAHTAPCSAAASHRNRENFTFTCRSIGGCTAHTVIHKHLCGGGLNGRRIKKKPFLPPIPYGEGTSNQRPGGVGTVHALVRRGGSQGTKTHTPQYQRQRHVRAGWTRHS